MSDQDNTALDRKGLEAAYGQVWNEEELTLEFRVTAIIAPNVVVVRKGDGQVGSLTFQNQPRFYFNFVPTGRVANVNKLHLICVAILDTATAGGLLQERAEAIFITLSPFLSNVPDETVKLFEENVRRILDSNPEEAP
jgi:hypothetical protein